MSNYGQAALQVPAWGGGEALAQAHTDEDVAPGDIAVGVVIGRSSEYFDFFVFGIASVLVFPSLLFPFLPRLEGTLAAFGIFALAFVARPFGTALSMAVQRRWGRGTKLTLALVLLGACTVGMAFLPSYAQAGTPAITALVLLRLGQGLALGGSWDGLPSLLALAAPRQRRGWYAMLGQLGAPLGFALAASLFAYLHASLTPDEIPSSSTLLNVLRNLGGAFGIAIIATLIDNDTRTHVSQIGSTLAATSIEGQAYLMQLAQTMMAQGAGPEQAQLQARAMLSNTISREAAIMAYNQVFYVMGIFLLVASALMLLLKQPAPRAPDAEPVEA